MAGSVPAFIKSDGSCWTWGTNDTGQLGDNSITNRSSPVLVVGNHSFIAVAGATNKRVFGLKANGEIWGWGSNTNNELGGDSFSDKSSPILLVGGHSFIKLGGGQGSFNALKSNGEIWSWGSGSGGVLGDNTELDTTQPVLVVGNHSFIYITGAASSFALKSDGTCWAWGSNFRGGLGDNTINNRSSPVLVVGNHSFIKVVAGASNTTMGLKSDGSVWAWGNNFSGEIGDNTTTSRSSPVLVVGNHSFIDIDTSMGLKVDGSVWTWGGGLNGMLGDNTTTDKSSPVMVVGNHSFIRISINATSRFGLKANGEIWGWGTGSSGLLGDNTITNKSSPVLVVGNHSFASWNIREILVKLFYKTASTETGIASDVWHAYENPFTSLGYVKLRVEV